VRVQKDKVGLVVGERVGLVVGEVVGESVGLVVGESVGTYDDMIIMSTVRMNI